MVIGEILLCSVRVNVESVCCTLYSFSVGFFFWMGTSANKSRRIWLFLHKVAIYSKYAPTGCSHSFCKYFSCDSGYGFNVKWITKISDFSWTIPTVKMKPVLNSDLKQCRDIFCCSRRVVMTHDLLLFYHNSLLYPKPLFSQNPVFRIHSICVIVPTLTLNWVRFLLWAAAMLKQFLINSLG